MRAVKIADILLYDRQAEQFVGAELHAGVSDDQLRYWKKTWFPKLRRSTTEEDYAWDWRILNQIAQNEPGFKIFTITFRDEVQGLMMLEDGQVSKLPESLGEPIIYVTRLATAPWNRPTFTNTPHFSGVGKICILVAIKQSVAAGLKGRLGLHSLPGAERFYLGMGMLDLGIDPDHEGLRYFELPANVAQQ